MNISEDSSEGITLDDVEPSISGSVATDSSRIDYTGQNDLVFYLVVNRNRTADNVSNSEEESTATAAKVDHCSEDNQANVGLNAISNASPDIDNVRGSKNIADVTAYSLEGDLGEIDSSQHLISGFEHEEHADIVLDSATEEITVSNDAALTDTLPVEDSITSQLLQPSLNAVDSDSDVPVTQPDIPNMSIAEDTPENVTSTKIGDSHNLGVHQLVTIGGQTFLLFTGPAQENRLAKSDVTTGSVGDAAEEPLSKKIRLERPLSESLSAQALEGLQGISDIGLNVPDVPPVQQDVTSEDDGVAKPGKTAEDVDVTQTWFTTKDDKAAFQKTGQTWKQGQWSKDEIDVLQENIANYCKGHNIDDPAEVIFMMTKEERKNFYRTISKGLNRPLFSVYRRVIRMYDASNHMGKYSPEELEKLKALRKKLGTDWAAIGTAMGRSPSSVKDRCRLMKDQCNSGKWFPEEEKRLTEAVQRLTGMVPGESVTSGLSWAAVAEQVGTRSEKQCRTKWLNYLNWKQRGGTEWNREDDLVLIDKIYVLGVTEENQINWESLAADWPSARSPQWLRGKWWSLKRHVQDYHYLTFAEIIDYLKANNRTIIRSTGTNDGYAVKMPTPMTISLTLPVNVDAVTSGNAVAGTSSVHQFQNLAGSSSQVLSADSNCEQNILQTLTQQQMVEMQPGGGREFLNPSFPKNPQTLIYGIGSSPQSAEVKTENLENGVDPGSVYIGDSGALQTEDIVIRQDSKESQASPASYESHGESDEGCIIRSSKARIKNSVIVQSANSSRSHDVFSTANS